MHDSSLITRITKTVWSLIETVLYVAAYFKENEAVIKKK